MVMDQNCGTPDDFHFPSLIQITLTADFLELALQFGMIMMFACAFPLAFSFAALVNNSLVYSYTTLYGCFECYMLKVNGI